jgi:hypothetical protein
MTTGVNAFDREVINPRERPASSDINALQSLRDQTLREVLRYQHMLHNPAPADAGAGNPQSGFYGDGLRVSAYGGGSLTVLIPAGLGMIYDAGSVLASIGGVARVDDLSPYYPAFLSAPMLVALDAAPSSGQERYDIIEVTLDRRLENADSRDVLNTSTGVFEPTSVLKTLAYDLLGRSGRVVSPALSTTGIGYKVGTPAAVGAAVVPATTAGYTRIAILYVDSTGVVSQKCITDTRKLLGRFGCTDFAFRAAQAAGAPDIVSIVATPGLAPLPPGVAVLVRSPSSYSTEFYVVAGDLSDAQLSAQVAVRASVSRVITLQDYLVIGQVKDCSDPTEKAWLLTQVSALTYYARIYTWIHKVDTGDTYPTNWELDVRALLNVG